MTGWHLVVAHAVPAGATIRLSENRGPAAARNAGLEMVRTPLVAFVDADVRTRRGERCGGRSVAQHDDVVLDVS